MKEIYLIHGEVALVDDEDYERLNKYRWHCNSYGYARTHIKINGKFKFVYMHQMIIDIPKGMEADHANRNRLDNTRSNLRISTHAQNQANRPMQKNNKSGKKGVHWNKVSKKWIAGISCNGKLKNLGSYDNIDDAALAYKNAALKYYGEFAKV